MAGELAGSQNLHHLLPQKNAPTWDYATDDSTFTYGIVYGRQRDYHPQHQHCMCDNEYELLVLAIITVGSKHDESDTCHEQDENSGTTWVVCLVPREIHMTTT